MTRADMGSVRGLLLVTMLILSVVTFAIPASAASTDATRSVDSPTIAPGGSDDTITEHDADASIESGGVYWIGQTLYSDAFRAGDSVQLRRGSPDEDRGFVTQVQVDGDGELLVATDRRSADRYYLTDGEDTTLGFELANQTLSASIESDTVKNSGGSGPVEKEIVIESERTGYSYLVSSPQADVSDLDSIWPSGTRVDTNDDGVNDSIKVSGAGTSQSVMANFSAISRGTYDFTFTVVDTGASDAISIEVESSPPATADFAQNVVTGEVGTVIAIPITVSNTDSATLTVGSEEAGWKATLNVSDGNGDGQITVLMDTDNVHRQEAVFSAKSGDSVTTIGPEMTLKRRIAAGSYSMTLQTNGQVRNTGVISLTSPTTVCSRNVDALIEDYNANTDDIPWYLRGLLTNNEIQVLVNNDSEREYIVHTAQDRRVTDLTQGAASNPTVEVETNCGTVKSIANADNPGDEFGNAYQSGDIQIEGQGTVNFLLVETLKIVSSIAQQLGFA